MRTLRSIVLMIMLVAGVLAWPSALSASSVGCHGTGCRGKDPQAMGCWRDARTLAVRPIPGTAGAGFNEYVELRYSPRCGAKWARTLSRVAPQTIRTGAYVYGHFAATKVTKYGLGASRVWSKMWTGTVRACGGSIWTGDPTYNTTHCTF